MTDKAITRGGLVVEVTHPCPGTDYRVMHFTRNHSDYVQVLEVDGVVDTVRLESAGREVGRVMGEKARALAGRITGSPK